MHMCKKNELEEKRKGSIIEIQLIQIECIFEVKEDIKKKKRIELIASENERACMGVYIRSGMCFFKMRCLK